MRTLLACCFVFALGCSSSEPGPAGQHQRGQHLKGEHKGRPGGGEWKKGERKGPPPGAPAAPGAPGAPAPAPAGGPKA